MTAAFTNHRHRTDLLAVVLPLALLGLAGCPDDEPDSSPPTDSGNTKAMQLSVGTHHSCVVSDASELWCWGYNAWGQLGDGTTTGGSTPVRAAIPAAVKQVSAGGSHTCALTDAGKVYCFGQNSEGQLGDGTVTDHAAPAEVAGLTGVTEVSAGSSFTCALRSGDVWCWGANNLAQLGLGKTGHYYAPQKVNLGSVQASHIEAGSLSACALTSAGTAYCWGKTSPDLGAQAYLSPAALTIGTPAQELALGPDFWCSRSSSGTVGCWGRNGAGQLGNGTTTDSKTVVSVLLPGAARDVSIGRASADVIGIGVYDAFACAALVDGRAACWGVNGAGQLGDGTTENRSTPVIVQGLTDVIEVGASAVEILDTTRSFACAVRKNGEAWCWGANEGGQLGDGTTMASSVPVRVKLP